MSDLFSLHKGGNNWLEKPILKCRDEVETFQRLREPIVSSRVKGEKRSRTVRKNLSTPKKEKKMNRLLFKIYNEENANYYLENTGKI